MTLFDLDLANTGQYDLHNLHDSLTDTSSRKVIQGHFKVTLQSYCFCCASQKAGKQAFTKG